MWLNKVKLVACVFLAVTLAATGIGLAAQAWAGSDEGSPRRDPIQAVVEGSDAGAAGAAAGKGEVEALRDEIAKLRADLKTAVKEIKDALGKPAPEEAPFYRGKSARFWLEQAKDADVEFRYEAITALGFLAHQKASLVPALVEALKDPDPKVAGAARTALAGRGAEAMEVLLEVLQKDKSPSARAQAARALGEIGPPAKAAVPALIKALAGEETQIAAVGALGRIGGPEAKQALPRIVSVLDVLVKQHKAREVAIGPGSNVPTIGQALIRLDPALQEVL